MKKIILTFPLFILLLNLTSCTYEPIDKNNIFLIEQQANDIISDGKLYTLDEFKDSFMTEKGNFYDSIQTYRTRSYVSIGSDTMCLFSIDTLPKNGPGIYIRGRITTDDMAGNFYKTIVIQQIVNNQQQALRISVDMGSIGGAYAKGQEILIRCNGMAIGRYANQPQLCVPAYNNNIYAEKANEKIGWAPGRIPPSMFITATHRIGTPDISKIHYDQYTIEEIVGPASTMDDNCAYLDQPTIIEQARYLDGLSIVIKNLHCTGEYKTVPLAINKCSNGNPADDTNTNVFGPTTNNIGFPQGRLFADIADNKNSKTPKQRSVITLSTSEYAKYAHYYLPANIEYDTITKSLTFDYDYYNGDIYGILSFYMDNGNYKADKFNWSITPSSLDDIQLYDTNGVKWQNSENMAEYSIVYHNN